MKYPGRAQFSLDFLKSVLDAIPDPVFVKDHEHRWIFANDAFSKILGMPMESYIGKSDYDLFPKEIADVFWKKDDEIFGSGLPNENEEIILDPEKKPRIIVTKKTPLNTEEGKILVGIIRDITDEREMQKRSLVSEKMAAFGEVACGLAHDLNNPIAILQGRANQLSRMIGKASTDPEEVRKITRSIEESCDRAAQVIRELSKLGQTGQNRVESSFLVEKLFERVNILFKSRFESLGVTFGYEVSDQDLRASAVESEIHQTLITLTQHSFHAVYGDAKKEIRWNAEKSEDVIRLRITDSAKTRLKSVHSESISSFASTSKDRQITLVLGTLRNIVSANRGELIIGSGSDEWRFEVRLPIHGSVKKAKPA